MPNAFSGGAAAMAAVLIVSNYLVQFPLGNWLTWAAFTYPIAFLVTDCINRTAGAALATKVVLFGFLFGVPLSFLFILASTGDWFIAGRIAGASGLGFISAQAADIAIFSRLRNAAWWLPPVASSAPASLLDTTVFFFVAFAGTNTPWAALAAGDLAIKILMVVLLLPLYRLFISSHLAAGWENRVA